MLRLTYARLPVQLFLRLHARMPLHWHDPSCPIRPRLSSFLTFRTGATISPYRKLFRATCHNLAAGHEHAVVEDVRDSHYPFAVPKPDDYDRRGAGFPGRRVNLSGRSQLGHLA